MSISHNTFSIGKVFFHFPEIGSTNEQAKSLLAKSNPIEGTVISAGFQTGGKGQMGSRWESEKNQNILTSIIIYPEYLPLENTFLLNIAISLALKDVVSKYFEPTKIKWPNDIYANNKKLGGILIQNTIVGHQIQSTIVGIGLNINQLKFPKHLPKATSLALETQSEYVLDSLRLEIYAAIDYRLNQLKSRQTALLEREYIASLLNIDEIASYERENGELFEGIIRNVMPNGQLLIEVDGQNELFGLKEIKFL